MGASAKAHLCFLLAVLVTVGASPAARALEVHSFFDASCRLHSGILLDVDAGILRFLTVDGVREDLPRDQVITLVIHKTLENPLKQITVDDSLRGLARRVWIGNDEAPTFTGWPVGFFDDLFLF